MITSTTATSSNTNNNRNNNNNDIDSNSQIDEELILLSLFEDSQSSNANPMAESSSLTSELYRNMKD